jgi:hypothetical protein
VLSVLSLLYGVCRHLTNDALESVDSWGRNMNLKASHQAPSDALDRALHSAEKPTLDLLAKIITGVCTRVPLLGKAAGFDRLIELAKIGGWTDAAIALINLELPFWRVRRLAYENGEWRCSLSRQPNVPMEFDECEEATHEVMPLAILCAFVEACRARARQDSVAAVPHIQPWPEQAMCCENYR